MNKWTIFYSWQEDLPKDTNLNAIRNSLKKASAALESEIDNIAIEIDEATRNTPGSPNIPETIFEKIMKADVFVADISTINNDSQNKVPNSNVLIELGYAIAYLGWGRILLLFNKEFGTFPNDVPFDIDRHRINDYKITRKSDTNGKNQLLNDLIIELKKIIEMNPEKSFEKRNISHAEVKRRNDIDSLISALSNIHMPTMDDFIENIPYMIIGSIFHFWEGFKATVNGSNFHIYDVKANELIRELYVHWNNTLSYGHRYHPARGDKYIYSSTMDILTREEQKDYNYLTRERKKLYYSYRNFIDFIRSNYIEIDLNKTSTAAIDEYISFHKEFMENLNRNEKQRSTKHSRFVAALLRCRAKI